MHKPKIGNIYAVTGGDYMGEFFVLMESGSSYTCMSLPDFHIRSVPKDKFKFGIYNNILDFQETLPQEIFKDCLQKFNEIKAGNNN